MLVVHCLYTHYHPNDMGKPFWPTSITADSLEQAMIIGPRQEAPLFANRDKFDLVAVYDSSSTSFNPGDQRPLSILIRLISEQAFRKMLKRMPMLLLGGIDAWKKDVGEGELIRGPGYFQHREAAVEISRPVPVSPGQATALASMAAQNGDMYATKSGVHVGHGPQSSVSMDQPATISGHSR